MSSDAMFEGSSVYFQYVNGRAAHVKIDRSSVYKRVLGQARRRRSGPVPECHVIELFS